MITRTHLLFCSVVLNLCLLAALPVKQPRVEPNRAVTPKLPGSEPTRASGGAETAGFRWRDLESRDLRALVRNLRAIGCPEETLTDIVGARVARLYAVKIAAAQPAAGQTPYWERPRPWSPGDSRQQRELFKEHNALLKELLGSDSEAEDKNPAAQVAQQRFSYLPQETRDQLRALEDKYFDLEHRIYAAANGLMTGDDRNALSSLEQQKAADLKALLTPDEQLEYDLRNSSLANRLRMELGAFQPSEAEFRAIYQAQATRDATSAVGGSYAGADPAASPDAQFENTLRSALGDQRYEEYQRCQDPGYQSLLKIAERYNLPREVAGQVFELKQGVEAQTRQVMTTTGVGADQKQAWVQAAQTQTEQALASLLGAQGYSVYHDVSGDWIDRLGR